jgi:hypothetical protein
LNDVGGKFFISNVVALYIEAKFLTLKSTAIREFDTKIKLGSFIGHGAHLVMLNL